MVGISEFDYDAMDRLTRRVTATGALYYSYDLGGRKRTLKDRSFNETYYLYDGAGRLEWEVLDSGRTAYYLYDASGLVTRLRHPTGGAVSTTSYYGYDAAGRVSGIVHKVSSGLTPVSFSYVRDANGQAVVCASPNNVNTYYSYDALDRLELEDWQNKSHVSVYGFRYAYDAAGNRTNKTVISSPTSETYYDYDAVNQVTQEHVLGGDTTYYAYDAAQRMTSARTTALFGHSSYFSHDQRDWISGADFTSLASPDSPRAFAYNSLGERLVVDDEATTYWQHDGPKLLLERSEGGLDLRKYRHNQSSLDSMGSMVELFVEETEGDNEFEPCFDARGTMSRLLTQTGGQSGIFRDDFFGVRLGASTTVDALDDQRMRWVSPGFLKLNTLRRQFYLTAGGLYLPGVARTTVGGIDTWAGASETRRRERRELVAGGTHLIDTPREDCHPTPGTLRVVSGGSQPAQLPRFARQLGRWRGDSGRGDLGLVSTADYTYVPFEVRVDLDDRTTSWKHCVYSQYMKGVSFKSGKATCRIGDPAPEYEDLRRCPMAEGTTRGTPEPGTGFVLDFIHLVHTPLNIWENDGTVYMADAPGWAHRIDPVGDDEKALNRVPAGEPLVLVADFRVDVTGTDGEIESIYFSTAIGRNVPWQGNKPLDAAAAGGVQAHVQTFPHPHPQPGRSRRPL